MFLEEIGIKNLIIDIDGTILSVDDINVSKELIEKFIKIKQMNINMCLMSNNNEQTVKPVADILNINIYIMLKNL